MIFASFGHFIKNNYFFRKQLYGKQKGHDVAWRNPLQYGGMTCYHPEWDESHSLGVTPLKTNHYTGFLFITMKTGGTEQKQEIPQLEVDAFIYITATWKKKNQKMINVTIINVVAKELLASHISFEPASISLISTIKLLSV